MAGTNAILAGKTTRQATNSLNAGIFMPVENSPCAGMTVIYGGGYGVEDRNKRLITANTTPTHLDRRKPAGVALVEAIAVTTNDGFTNAIPEAVMPKTNISISTESHQPIITTVNHNGTDIRCIIVDENPWFAVVDICKGLNIQNPTQAASKLDDDERAIFNIGRQGSANFVNESGLYALMLRCRDAMTKGTKAHKFRKWVTNEVLPTIRKTGEYTPAQGTPISEEPPRITAQQLHELNQKIRRAVTVFHFEEKATQRVCNNIRFMLNIGNVADIHPDDYNAEMDLKLPRNPDWQQAVKTLEAKQLENRGGQH